MSERFPKEMEGDHDPNEVETLKWYRDIVGDARFKSAYPGAAKRLKALEAKKS